VLFPGSLGTKTGSTLEAGAEARREYGHGLVVAVQGRVRRGDRPGEALQPGGDTNFRSLLPQIEKLCARIGVPVLAKGVGSGIAASTARRLVDAGIAAIDVAGAGGTSWARVEGKRSGDPARERIAEHFGDWGYTIGIITIFLVFGSMNFVDVFKRLEESAPAQGVLTLICIALFFGATGKSAQLPLYSWLPDAMEGPTPVSALIHAATMVTSGVYLVARSMPLFEVAGPSLQVVGVVGAITAIFAATIALVQFDIKRVMAYSTVSQLGYMFLALGVGAPVAAIFHLATHAFFKALLFLGSGSVIHGLGGEQDMRKMGGLRRKMPLTFWTMLIAGGALAALPPLAGFWSKDEILGAAFTNGHLDLYAIGIITAVLTAFYVTRTLWMTFYGEPRDHHLYDHAHVSPRVMTLPLIALAAGSAVLGIVIGFPPEQGFIQSFLGPVVEAAGVPERVPELATILALALVSVLAGLIGIAVGVSMYVRHRPDPAALTRAAGPVYRILANKYYIDELYDHRFVEAARALAGASWAFDIHIIDGLANRLGWALAMGGQGLRRVQTGIVGNYALTIVAGLLLMLVAYGGYAAGILGR